MKHRSIKKETILLFAIIILADFLRFYNLNWDEGHYFQPDERNIANAVSKIDFLNQLNPQFFAYGGFTIYLNKAVANILTFFTHDPSWGTDWAKINLIGRTLSASFSTITIIPLYLLSKKIFGQKVAIVASLIYALTVASIQAAHFGTTESLLTLFVTTLTLLSFRIFENPKLDNYLLTAIIFGLAVATKTTSLIFAIFPLMATFLVIIQRRVVIAKILLSVFVFGLTSFIVFTIFSPYTFLSWDKFWESMTYESGVASGSLPVVYTLQFNHTLPYLFQITNFFWQLGPMAIFTILGIVVLLKSLLKRESPQLLLFLSFPIIYFTYVGTWHAKFIRYMIPIIPFLIIFASYILVRLQGRFSTWGRIFVAGVLILTGVWALAFFSIYTREQTRISASIWIYQHIPPGSYILQEHWDDGLPLPLEKFSPDLYRTEQLTIYEPDNRDKLEYYSKKLSQADYIAISSRRLYGTLINLPEKYPLTSKYYRLLFEGSLGYSKVAEFSSYPSFLGLEINDDSSEESFQVFDHPKVLIFQNIEHFGKEHYLNLLGYE